MPKVRLDEDYDYHPSKEPRVCRGYKANKKPQAMNEECAARVVAAGIGEIIVEKKPQK